YLPLRNLNQDPVENLLCQIIQHGVFNTSPTCSQFTSVLKTVLVNKFASPLSRNSNCKALFNLSDYLSRYSKDDFEMNENESESIHEVGVVHENDASEFKKKLPIVGNVATIALGPNKTEIIPLLLIKNMIKNENL